MRISTRVAGEFASTMNLSENLLAHLATNAEHYVQTLTNMRALFEEIDEGVREHRGTSSPPADS
jgi:hypothetical protein